MLYFLCFFIKPNIATSDKRAVFLLSDTENECVFYQLKNRYFLGLDTSTEPLLWAKAY